MASAFEKFQITTNGFDDVIDITSKVENIIASKGVKDGILTLSTDNSQAGIIVFQYDKEKIRALIKKLDSTFAPEFDYRNGLESAQNVSLEAAKALILGKTLTLPVVGSKPELSNNQRIIFIDFNKKSDTIKVTLVLTY